MSVWRVICSQILVYSHGAFRQVWYAQCGTCNNGNFGDLPEIHQEKMVGAFLTKLGLARSEWGAGKESVSV